MTPRTAEFERRTKETDIRCEICLDGAGRVSTDTGIGFLDHMVDTLARHARFDLVIECTGDLHIDDHHTVEDCAIALGSAVDRALGDRRGIRRFGEAHAPLDEALARCVIDLSGRPWHEVNLDCPNTSLGGVYTENLAHFLRSFATCGRMSLHVDMLRGENVHHKVEAAFKAVALALRQAMQVEGDDIPSTKGVLG